MTDTDSFVDALLAQVEALVAADVDAVDVDTDLLLEGLVDSMGVVELVQWIEDRCAIRIDPADVVLENFRSVRAMVDYVEGRLTPADR